MTVALVVNGTTYSYPTTGDEGWGTDATNWAQAVTNGMLQKSGGTFTLTADANFGVNFGLVSLYFKSVSSNIATTEIVRLANDEGLAWRNAANSADLVLKVDTGNKLEFNGDDLATETYVNDAVATANEFTELTDTPASYASQANKIPAVNVGETALEFISIADANIDASAAITLSKLATLTASRALVSDGSGVISASAVTATELALLSGLTGALVDVSSAQTLTNKTIDADNNTISNLAHGAEVDNPTSGVHGVTGNVVGTSDAQALTNKTIDGDLNTISNLAHGAEVDNPTSGVHGVTGNVVGTSDSQSLSNKIISIQGAGANTIGAASDGAAVFVGNDLTVETYLDEARGGFGKEVDPTGLTDGDAYIYNSGGDNFVRIAAVGLTDAQTLTNKTISAANNTLTINLDDLSDVTAPSPGDGEALVYDSTSGDWIPGASGDASFKVASATTTTLTIKGGGMWYNGREYVTYDGAGLTPSDFNVDLTYAPAGLGATQDYYLYIDTLGLTERTINNGRVVLAVENTDFHFDTGTPYDASVDLNRYIPIGFFQTNGSSQISTTSGTFGTLAQRHLVNWVNFKAFNAEDWQDATFVTNNTTNVTQVSKYRRIGANMHGRMTLEWSGANTQASINISPPSGFTIDETKTTDERTSVGQWIFRQASTGNYWSGGVFYSGSANVMFLPLSDGSGGTFDPSDGLEPVTIANGDYLSIEFNVPIEGWSDNSDTIATPVQNQQTRITSVNGTPGTGKHRYTFDSAFEDNRYNVYVLRNDSGTATFPIFGAVENQTSTYVDLDLSSYTVDASNWVDVFVGRGPRTAVLPSIKWQQKTVTSNISSSGSISALTFNNLEVGKTYEIYLGTQVITEAADSDAFITVTHDGNNICFAGINDDDSISQPQGRFVGLTATKIFVATGTTVTFTANIAGTASILGSGSVDITYAILKELPNHEQTSQWT